MTGCHCGGGDDDNPCNGISCSGRGFCFVEQDAAYCACLPGYHAVGHVTCQSDDPLDPCNGVDCQGNGSCREEEGQARCDCFPGFDHPTDAWCSAFRCDLLCVPLVPADGGPDTCDPVSSEECNGRDDDCDGLVDEAFDLDFDRNNCGACGVSCPDGPHGSGACILGACAMTCEPGWSDLDFDPRNGCEAGCTPVDVPDETLCEGRDEDCDGLTDEDWAPTEACGIGVCRRLAVCFRGATQCRARMPPAAADATCDGLDDDCDGRTDEDCSGEADADADAEEDADADADVRDTPSNCGNGVRDPDEECDGDGPAPCTTTCGSTGSRICSGCRWSACTPPAETCNGNDDDCDTVVDDGFTCRVGETDSCTTSCGSTGSHTCSSICSWGSCNPPAETCNGNDDDCDTVCDDRYSCCRGRTYSCSDSHGCPGSRTCSSSCSLGTCTVPASCTDYYGDHVCNGSFGSYQSNCLPGECRECQCDHGTWVYCGSCRACPS